MLESLRTLLSLSDYETWFKVVLLSWLVIGIILFLFISPGAKKHAKEPELVTISSKVQTVQSSPGSMNIQADVVNIQSSKEFKPISAEIDAQLTQKLKDFKVGIGRKELFVRVDIETGSSLRDKVATTLGNALRSAGLGDYPKGNTFMGVLPDYPVTILCAEKDQDIAMKFQQAIAVFLRGGTHIKADPGFNRHFIRVYLYGQPLFENDGSVTFQ
jgi:hypothetical protein